MKKYIVIAVCLGSFLPLIAAAQTSGCVSLSSGMGYGATGAQVSSLQSYLHGQGYLSVGATGFYGSLTTSAVKNFQGSNGIPTTGYVGPLTRGKIQSASCSTTAISGGSTTGSLSTTATGSTCASGALFDPISGQRCTGSEVQGSTFLPGCSSTSGFSTMTGDACDGSTPAAAPATIAAPTLTNVSPTTAPSETLVTLTGTGFTSSNAILFTSDGKDANSSSPITYTIVSGAVSTDGTTLTFIANASIYNYQVSVRTANGTSNSLPITIIQNSAISHYGPGGAVGGSTGGTAVPGCTLDSQVYSSTTGALCKPVPGCSSIYGYSTTTGDACNGSTPSTSSGSGSGAGSSVGTSSGSGSGTASGSGTGGSSCGSDCSSSPLAATPTSGPAPLTVNFNTHGATELVTFGDGYQGESVCSNGVLSYGACTNGGTASVSHYYPNPGTYTASLSGGNPVTITVGAASNAAATGAAPTLSNVNPTVAQSESMVTLTGTGFTSTNNTIFFTTNGSEVNSTTPQSYVIASGVSSSNGTSLTFIANASIFSGYQVSVHNANGISNSLPISISQTGVAHNGPQ